MIDYKNFDLYTGETIDKQLKITFDSGTITNTEIPSEQFELTESLTSESQLVFGSCEASEIKFRIYNVFLPLKDKWLTVTQTLNGDTENPLQIGKYKVYSDKPTADRGYRDVVAYDAMYDIINTDVASWYNSLTFPMSLKAFRDSFFAFFGIEQEEVSLVNDSMEIERTIEPSVLSGKDVIQSICEINGCFGHINRNGNFQYITLSSGLYPAEDLYPSDYLFLGGFYGEDIDKSLYLSADYEDYVVQNITGLQIRQEANDIGAIVGTNDNLYIIQDNFLVYGKSEEDLTVIASNALGIISNVSYRPFNATIVGNPCFEVGDAIVLHTKHQDIETYIFNRTLSGVQNLRDDFLADGEEYQSEKVNDIQTQITQLKGKTNTLKRTVDETRSMITDVEENLQSEITQTAEQIELKVSKGEVSAQLSVESEQITISGNRLVVDSTNFNLNSEGDVALTGEVHATEFVADEKMSIKSGWLIDGNSDYEDVLYTEQETLNDGRTWSYIHAAISYIEKELTIKGVLRAMAGIEGGVTNLTQLKVTGTKSRLASTENYNERLLYCYETPSPFFGDIGHGVIGEDGTCYVDIDSIFAETIDTIQEYYVFLTPYKTDKAMFVAEKEHGYFIVKGEPNTEFDWEIKAKQLDFPMERLEENIIEDTNDIDYEEQAINYLNEYEKELTSYEY